MFPCGGKQGATVDCSVSGADLEGISGLYFSHAGIRAQPAEAGKWQVEIEPGVPPGLYDVRAITPRGLSNFRAFTVGDSVEVVEQEPNQAPGAAQPVTLPLVITGRIDPPTDLDRFRFEAKAGQRVLIECRAWRIDSPLDATLRVFDPRGKEVAYSGDDTGKDPFVDFIAQETGEYVVEIWDFVYGGGPDHVYRLQIGGRPRLEAAIPAAVRRGARTSVTLVGRNLPGGRPAAQDKGRAEVGLELVTQVLDLTSDRPGVATFEEGEVVRPAQTSLDGIFYAFGTEQGRSNPIFLGFTEDPIGTEQEPNNALSAPQQVPFPCEMTGTFAPSGDVDYYRFEVSKGEQVIIEVYGERQSGQVDPFLAVFDPAGKRLYSGDDAVGKDIGQLRFSTRTRDSRFEFRPPSAGGYTVQVRDLYFQQRGAARFVYRLSLRRPRPDFRLLAVPTNEVQPDATTVGRGGRTWLDVLAFRTDGFEEAIRVEATDLPPGVVSEPVVIGPGKNSVPLVFNAAPNAPIGHAEIQIKGTAEVSARKMVTTARGGGLTWPTVNTPGIARMARSVPIAVRERPPFVLTATPVQTKVEAGGTLKLTVTLERSADWSGAVQLSGFDLPPDAKAALVNLAAESVGAVFEVVLPPNLRPGAYTFLVQGAGQVPRDYGLKSGSKDSAGTKIRAVFPSNPITITVSESSRATR